MQTNILFTGDLMFKCTIWLDAACLSSTLCESEAISQSPPTAHLICRESRVRPINAENWRQSHTESTLLTGAASVITHQLSLKGKAAADVAEVAKHLNITQDVRDAENAGGIAECSHIMEFTV